MLRAVIDTNILIRASLKNTGSDFLIYKAFLDGKFELLYSEKMISEIKRVFYYPRIYKKYNLSNEFIFDFIRSITAFGKFVYNPPPVKICRDKDDDELISIAKFMAIKTPVYIVSGDKDLLELKGKVKKVKIVTASQFINVISN